MNGCNAYNRPKVKAVTVWNSVSIDGFDAETDDPIRGEGTLLGRYGSQKTGPYRFSLLSRPLEPKGLRRFVDAI